MACNFRDWQMEARRNGFCIARDSFLSLCVWSEASIRRWQSYGCDPSMSLASTIFHKPALFLGDLGGTFREERERARARDVSSWKNVGCETRR